MPDAQHRPALATEELWARYLWPRLAPHLGISATASAPAAPLENAPGAAMEASTKSTPITPMAPTSPEEQEDQVCLAPLTQACQAARKAHANFAILFSPALNPWPLTPNPPRALAQLAQWCRRQGVPLIDVSSAFALHPGKEIYLDDIHLRPAGQAIIAQEIESHWPELIASQSADVSPSDVSPSDISPLTTKPATSAAISPTLIPSR